MMTIAWSTLSTNSFDVLFGLLSLTHSPDLFLLLVKPEPIYWFGLPWFGFGALHIIPDLKYHSSSSSCQTIGWLWEVSILITNISLSGVSLINQSFVFHDDQWDLGWASSPDFLSLSLSPAIEGRRRSTYQRITWGLQFASLTLIHSILPVKNMRESYSLSPPPSLLLSNAIGPILSSSDLALIEGEREWKVWAFLPFLLRMQSINQRGR